MGDDIQKLINACDRFHCGDDFSDVIRAAMYPIFDNDYERVAARYQVTASTARHWRLGTVTPHPNIQNYIVNDLYDLALKEVTEDVQGITQVTVKLYDKKGSPIEHVPMVAYFKAPDPVRYDPNPYDCEGCGKTVDADDPEEAAWSGPDGSTIVCLECEPDWRKPSEPLPPKHMKSPKLVTYLLGQIEQLQEEVKDWKMGAESEARERDDARAECNRLKKELETLRQTTAPYLRCPACGVSVGKGGLSPQGLCGACVGRAPTEPQFEIYEEPNWITYERGQDPPVYSHSTSITSGWSVTIAKENGKWFVARNFDNNRQYDKMLTTTCAGQALEAFRQARPMAGDTNRIVFIHKLKKMFNN